MSTPSGLVILTGSFGHMTIQNFPGGEVGIAPIADVFPDDTRVDFESAIEKLAYRKLSDMVGNVFLTGGDNDSSAKFPSICAFRMSKDEDFFIARGMEERFTPNVIIQGVYAIDGSAENDDLLEQFKADRTMPILTSVLSTSVLQPVHSSITLTRNILSSDAAAGAGMHSAHYGSSAHYGD